MGGGFFGPTSFGKQGGPGGLNNFTLGAVNQAQGQASRAVANRYNQLGEAGMTGEAMDLGQAPSYTGGIPAQFSALEGELQDVAAQEQPQGSGGKGSSPASTIGGVGQLLGGLGV